jgi:hypothetical protein
LSACNLFAVPLFNQIISARILQYDHNAVELPTVEEVKASSGIGMELSVLTSVKWVETDVPFERRMDNYGETTFWIDD